jgi:uncharacterized membrane protein
VKYRNPAWAWRVTLPISLAALGVSIYLTIAHFRHATSLAGCSAGATENCIKVTTSSQSEIFGHIPVAVTGLVYYVIMAALMTPWAWQQSSQLLTRLRLAAAAAGLGMVFYLVYVETVQLKAICLYCTSVHILTFLLFVAVLSAYLFRPILPAGRARSDSGHVQTDE